MREAVSVNSLGSRHNNSSGLEMMIARLAREVELSRVN